MPGPGVHVALLRGINVGRANKLPMKQLALIFEACGAKEVRTWIQSGNVVFRASAKVARDLPGKVTAAIEDELGLKVPVVARSARQMEAIVKANPYRDPDLEPKHLHVYFLSGTPTPGQVAALDPDRSPPDVFCVNGSEIYVRFGKGVAETRLTNAWFDRQLGVVSTARNWNTVVKILQMCRG